ncbi:unnamed protein product [Didymodactylos carnosus]|uniref:Uncharacterized protein n=1 Tax=Didymodactylos carnosus TaxID=1234261 RepID=A0A8S2TM69_9BILA|nr:unnamed protein product [Didymodactylos carnosus]
MAAANSTVNEQCKLCENGKYKCQGCHLSCCKRHFDEHRQQLASQFDKVIYEHDVLQELLNPKSSTNNNKTDDLLQKIDHWEIETIQNAKYAAQRAREKVKQLMKHPSEQIQKEFSLITNELKQSTQDDDYLEPDFERWSQQLRDLKVQLQSTSDKIQINTGKSDEIDWSTLIKVDTINGPIAATGKKADINVKPESSPNDIHKAQSITSYTDDTQLQVRPLFRGGKLLNSGEYQMKLNEFYGKRNQQWDLIYQGQAIHGAELRESHVKDRKSGSTDGHERAT